MNQVAAIHIAVLSLVRARNYRGYNEIIRNIFINNTCVAQLVYDQMRAQPFRKIIGAKLLRIFKFCKVVNLGMEMYAKHETRNLQLDQNGTEYECHPK